VTALLRQTTAGQSLMKRLGGKRPNDKALADSAFAIVADKLKECTNLPLTMAVVQRLHEFHDVVKAKSPSLAKAGFDEKAKPLSAADQKAVEAFATTIFTPGFIANVPAITGS
jgi:hypothetical protein